MEFGEKIQKLRNQNKWTQEQLAENYMCQELLCQNGKVEKAILILIH